MKKLLTLGLFVGAVTQAQTAVAEEASQFIRGDANCDAVRDISDPIYSLNYQFGSRSAPCCQEVIDTNGDGQGDISDAIFDLNFQFVSGTPPPAPHPTCGSIEGVECAGHPCNLPGAFIDWVTVGSPGNPPDSDGFGSVTEAYRIAKFEVTNAQWTKFLNTVDPAGDNALQLFDVNMEADPKGGIALVSANDDGAKFVAKEDRSDKPVVYIDWFSAVRFCNWLHNDEGGPGSTEDGAYETIGGDPITGVTDALQIQRTADARFFVPTKNEWLKAAYYEPNTQTYFALAVQVNGDVGPFPEAPPGGDRSVNTDFAVGDMTDVGSYASAPSPHGTFDQCGNVSEWIEHGFSSDSQEPLVLGSHWRFAAVFCWRFGHDEWRAADFRGDHVGFRPAASVVSP